MYQYNSNVVVSRIFVDATQSEASDALSSLENSFGSQSFLNSIISQPAFQQTAANFNTTLSAESTGGAATDDDGGRAFVMLYISNVSALSAPLPPCGLARARS